MDARIRLHLVYGSRLLADTFAAGFARREELELRGSTSLDTTSHETIGTEELDALLIDASVDPDAALDLVRRVAPRLPSTEIVLLGIEEPDRIVRFLEAGATGCVKRGATLEELLDTVRSLRRQEAVCCPRLTASVIERLAELSRQVADRPEEPTVEDVRLTARESEVLELVAAGYQNKEIARELGISLPTVKNHVHKIIDKLNASGRREAVRLAYLNGFIEDPLPWLDAGLETGV